MTTDVLLVGSGSLARAVCCSLVALATGAPDRTRVSVVGRTPGRVAELAYLATLRGHAAGARPTRVSVEAAGSDLRVDALARTVARLRPAVVLVCASPQSPWEGVDAPSGWTRLVERAGFGLTLPLQAGLACDVAAALARTGQEGALVNACLPDAVNPVLAALGLPVRCGVGNAELVATALRAALVAPPERRLRVLAHHVHLHPPDTPADDARAWLDDTPVADVTALLAPMRGVSRRRLNLVTGHGAARIVLALAHDTDLATSLPGPHGLPGGYPVRVTGGRITLDLPAAVSRADAIAWNRRAAARDGVDVDGGVVRPGPAARDVLADHLPDLADGYPVAELPAVRARLLELRTRLRRTTTVDGAATERTTTERTAMEGTETERAATERTAMEGATTGHTVMTSDSLEDT